MTDDPEAIVVGRLHADLYPQQVGVRLEDVVSFERFVGGFAGNVGVGLARLGVRTAIVSAVGDDGHGRFVRRFLEEEGIETRWVSTAATGLTPLTFCEIRPPSDFPLLAYRPPESPDWRLTPEDILQDVVRGAPILMASGTGFAVEPSRSTTHWLMEERRHAGRDATTILDMDWRSSYWSDATEYGPQIMRAARSADVLIGSDKEFRAAGSTPGEALALGPRLVFVKHGPNGATLLGADRAAVDVPGFRVEVVNGLGAGDAFAAAAAWGILRGFDHPCVLRLANVAGALVAERIPCSAGMPTASELTARAGEPVVPSLGPTA
jgi:5-dehydro-2-deoxygluconokinase